LLSPPASCAGSAVDTTNKYSFCYKGLKKDDQLSFAADGTVTRESGKEGVWYYTDTCKVYVDVFFAGEQTFDFVANTSSLTTEVNSKLWTLSEKDAGAEGFCEVTDELLSPPTSCAGRTVDTTNAYSFCYRSLQ
jgi:hypothetical protein